MTTFTNPFTGDVIDPTDVSYAAYTIATSTALVWPVNGDTSTTVAARIMQITASAGSLSLSMPPANQVSVGQDALIRNVGANTFTIKTYTGSTIGTIAAGEAKYIYVTDNSTDTGVWGIFTFGTGTSAADASALAGYGLLAISTTLNQSHPTATLTVNQTMVLADRAQAYIWTGGAGTTNLPIGSVLGSSWFVLIKNNGTGTLNVTPDAAGGELIDGANYKAFAPGDSAFVLCTGTGYVTVGFGQSSQFAFTALTKPVTGGTVTLSSNEATNTIMTFIGTLVSNVTIVFPPVVNFYVISNQCTAGTYTMTVTTGSGATAVIPSNGQATVICDGTNFYNANTLLSGATSFSIVDGSAASPAINFSSETNTGIYRPGTGQFGLSILGTLRFNLSASGLAITGTGNFSAGVSGGSF